MFQYRIASSLGPQYMVPQPVANLEEAERFMTNHSRLLGGLPGSETVRIECRDQASASEWRHFDPWSEPQPTEDR